VKQCRDEQKHFTPRRKVGQGRSYFFEPPSGDLNVMGHLSGFATRQSGVLGIRGPASFDETLGIRAAAIEARVNKKPRRALPAGLNENE
jgi:hypothetical protein